MPEFVGICDIILFYNLHYRKLYNNVEQSDLSENERKAGRSFPAGAKAKKLEGRKESYHN
jgi:hypothetical protein